MTAKSIDCLKERMGIMDFAHITRKEEAAVIANKALESGIIFSNNMETDAPFRGLVQGLLVLG